MQQTRQTLIERLRDKYDEESWQTFTQIYQRYIYVVIRRMNISHSETEDLVQEVLFKIWNKLPDFQYSPDKAKFRTWLSTVVKNKVLNYLESSKSHANKIDRASQQPVNGNVPNDIELIMQKEWENYITNMAMERIKGSFPGQAIRVFELTLEGKSVEAIAAELNIKENTVYRSKNRVKAKLINEIANLRLELE